jgi:hypothetical protein
LSISNSTCSMAHTSAYVSIRQHASACVSMRQQTSACVSIRQHTSAYVRRRCLCPQQHLLHAAYVSIRQHTSAYIHRCIQYVYIAYAYIYIYRLTYAIVFLPLFFPPLCTTAPAPWRRPSSLSL